MSGYRERLIALMSDGRIVRYRDLRDGEFGGIPPAILSRLASENMIKREADGYRLSSLADLTPEEERYVTIGRKHPGGVLCFTTAISFANYLGANLDMTDGFADVDTVALPLTPAFNSHSSVANLRIAGWSNPAMFTLGVEEVTVAGTALRFTSPERTAADMFMPARGRRLPQAEDAALRALSELATVRGEASLSRVEEYCTKLGWWTHSKPFLQMARQMLPRISKPAEVEETSTCAPRM